MSINEKYVDEISETEVFMDSFSDVYNQRIYHEIYKKYERYAKCITLSDLHKVFIQVSIYKDSQGEKVLQLIEQNVIHESFIHVHVNYQLTISALTALNLKIKHCHSYKGG